MGDFISNHDRPKKSPVLTRQIVSTELIPVFDLVPHRRHNASNKNLFPQGMTGMSHVLAQITNGLVGVA